MSEEARSSSSIQYKEEGDARSALTVADTTAQKVIIASLLKTFPGLKIIGEEDEAADETAAVDLDTNLQLNFVGGVYYQSMPLEVDFNDVTAYVDPLDGTREFVEGRFDNVQCLVGLCHRNIPIMGAVGLPFPSGESGNHVQVVYGLVGRGIGKLCIQDGTVSVVALPALHTYTDGDKISLSSGDSNSILLLNSIALIDKIIPNVDRQIVGACGSKMMKVVMGETTFSVMHDKTSLWDTCAPTALVSAVGGKVTNLFGDPLLYNEEELGNKLGVLVSAAGAEVDHDNIASAMRTDAKLLSVLQVKTRHKR
jgi:3'(2'), 5'-bisphosphate nucleotidase